MMSRKYGLERSRQITAEAPEPLMKPDVPELQRTCPMTEAQGERIIELLEELVTRTQSHQPPPLPYPERSAFQESLDKAIAEDFKRCNASYPS